MNFLLHDGPLSPEDEDLIKGVVFETDDRSPGEFTQIPRSSTMIDVLVLAGVFPSKGQARKNWKGPVEIPDGFSVDFHGKRRTEICTHKPILLKRSGNI